MRITRTRIYTLAGALLLPLAGLFLASAGAQTAGARAPKKDTKKYKTEKPDLAAIQRAVLDPSSPYYYPKLMTKYERKDTTMTPDEFRHFYLGYMFQEDFDPYRTSPYANKTDHLRTKKSHTKQEMDTIEKYANLALEDNPFDLRQMSFLVHVLKEKKKDMRAKIWEYRLENLLGTIMSTGTGKDVDNPWYVVYPMHEYDVAQLLGYEAVDVEYPRDGFDYLIVQPDESDTRRRDKSAKGFYYNVVIPQEQYELKHGGDEEVTSGAPEEIDDGEDYDEIPAE
ncbi:MAG: DUF4919 domain-containing protein [Muribaculaceae bacterium]|nr:DUF4919 domain-containing protein [Muribaculaceae bacterium]